MSCAAFLWSFERPREINRGGSARNHRATKVGRMKEHHGIGHDVSQLLGSGFKSRDCYFVELGTSDGRRIPGGSFHCVFKRSSNRFDVRACKSDAGGDMALQTHQWGKVGRLPSWQLHDHIKYARIVTDRSHCCVLLQTLFDYTEIYFDLGKPHSETRDRDQCKVSLFALPNAALIRRQPDGAAERKYRPDGADPDAPVASHHASPRSGLFDVPSEQQHAN